MENTAQPRDIQLDQKMENMQTPNNQLDQSAKTTTAKNKRLLPLLLGLLLLVVATGVYFLSQNFKNAPPTQTAPTITKPDSSASESADALMESPSTAPDQKIASDSDKEATLSPTASQTENTYPAGWKTHVFPEVGVTLAAPAQWQSDLQSFPNTDSHLIRLWQGATADSATIQLDVKSNWDNTGNAQYLAKNISLKNGVMASKVDPPKLDRQHLIDIKPITTLRPTNASTSFRVSIIGSTSSTSCVKRC